MLLAGHVAEAAVPQSPIGRNDAKKEADANVLRLLPFMFALTCSAARAYLPDPTAAFFLRSMTLATASARPPSDVSL